MINLTDAHVKKNFELQLSGYYTGKVDLKSDGHYYQSKQIPSTSWNHCVGLNPSIQSEFDFGQKLAKKRGVPLAFFIRERDIEQIPKQNNTVIRERWMMSTPETIVKPREPQNVQIKFIMSSKINSDFASVIGSLFEEDEYNERFKNFYIPTLKEAISKGKTQVVHAVLYENSRPVSCGSVYVSEGFAGIYNIGTKFGEGKQGFGSYISYCLIHKAFSMGAESVFLQCVIGTHVEKLYESIGFSSKECPAIVVYE